jgi:hypothetical protein
VTHRPWIELERGTELRAVTAGATVVAALLAIGSRWFGEVAWTLGALAVAELLVAASAGGGFAIARSVGTDRRSALFGVGLLGVGAAVSALLAPQTSWSSLPLAGGVVAALSLTRPSTTWGGGTA